MKTNHKEIIMEEFLNNQVKELMQKHGITRLEALQIVAEVLKEDQDKPVMQVTPEYSNKDFLIMLLENLRDDIYSNRYARLCDIAMFLHRDECEPHTPYIPRNSLNMSDMNILEREYKLTQNELRHYKLIDFE